MRERRWLEYIFMSVVMGCVLGSAFNLRAMTQDISVIRKAVEKAQANNPSKQDVRSQEIAGDKEKSGGNR